jgi:hypothetical protein
MGDRVRCRWEEKEKDALQIQIHGTDHHRDVLKQVIIYDWSHIELNQAGGKRENLLSNF